MPNTLTRADSLREFLTGAGSDGGSQTDPNASLGNFRSSTEALTYGISITSAIANITIDFASGGNAEGLGNLDCTGVSTLRWRDNGGTYGNEVTILNGETKVIEASGDPGAFVRVTRTSATNLVTGTANVTLTVLQNNVFGLDDVSSAEASAGDAEYRATIVRNVSSGNVTLFKRWLGTLGTSRVSGTTQLGASGAGTIAIASGDFNDWPESGWCRIQLAAGTLREIVYYSSRTSTVLTVPAAGRQRLGTTNAAGASDDTIHAVPGCAIALDLAGIITDDGAIDTIANENTAPSPSVTWVTGIIAAEGLNIGTLQTGDHVGIWIWRDTPVGAISITQARHLFRNSFDAA